MSEITPGLSIDFVFENDYHRGNFRLLNAIVYEVSGRKITISQPSQQLASSQLGQGVIVTYCITQGGQTERYGFSAKVTSFINDYKIGSLQHSTALVLERKSTAEEMNVRLHFRIKPTLDCGLSLYHRENKLNLIDISLGGARFTDDKIGQLSADDTIPLKLEIDQRLFAVEARVIRSWLSTLPGKIKKIQFVAVKFLYGNPDMEQLLSNKILAIQRQRLAEGKLHK